MKKIAGVGRQAQYFAICCKIQSASNSYFTMDSQIPDSRHETGESLRKLENDAVDKTARRPCVQREGVQCETTEADTEQPIAAPAWKFYGTRPSLRDLCVLRTVRAAGRGFRAGTGHSAGRCTLGRLFGLRDAARPRN